MSQWLDMVEGNKALVKSAKLIRRTKKMRVDKTICDVCGHDMTDTDRHTRQVIISAIPFSHDVEWNARGYEPQNLDICPQCQEKVYNAIRHLGVIEKRKEPLLAASDDWDACADYLHRFIKKHRDQDGVGVAAIVDNILVGLNCEVGRMGKAVRETTGAALDTAIIAYRDVLREQEIDGEDNK